MQKCSVGKRKENCLFFLSRSYRPLSQQYLFTGSKFLQRMQGNKEAKPSTRPCSPSPPSLAVLYCATFSPSPCSNPGDLLPNGTRIEARRHSQQIQQMLQMLQMLRLNNMRLRFHESRLLPCQKQSLSTHPDLQILERRISFIPSSSKRLSKISSSTT